jgi:hypothetical protein
MKLIKLSSFYLFIYFLIIPYHHIESKIQATHLDVASSLWTPLYVCLPPPTFCHNTNKTHWISKAFHFINLLSFHYTSKVHIHAINSKFRILIHTQKYTLYKIYFKKGGPFVPKYQNISFTTQIIFFYFHISVWHYTHVLFWY